MKTCNICGETKKLTLFGRIIGNNGKEYLKNFCKYCESRKAREKYHAAKSLKKISAPMPKNIIPTFLRPSLVSVGNKHTVKALIKNGAMYKYEESFSSKEKAQCMIEKINADPKIAVKFLDKSKPANYKAVNKNLR